MRFPLPSDLERSLCLCSQGLGSGLSVLLPRLGVRLWEGERVGLRWRCGGDGGGGVIGGLVWCFVFVEEEDEEEEEEEE